MQDGSSSHLSLGRVHSRHRPACLVARAIATFGGIEGVAEGFGVLCSGRGEQIRCATAGGQQRVVTRRGDMRVHGRVMRSGARLVEFSSQNFVVGLELLLPAAAERICSPLPPIPASRS